VVTNTREYSYNDLAGCVVQRRSRSTGYLVGLYHADQAQLDSSSGPWATICEEHGHVINHDTLALARSHLADPAGWCDLCIDAPNDLKPRNSEG
jgi:hypothetical protein